MGPAVGGERDVGDADGGGCADHRGNLRRVVVIHGHDGAGDDDVVAQVGGEEGAHGPVDHAAGQNAALGGTAFFSEVSARNPADGVNLLFKIHAQREVVDVVPGTGGRRGGDEHRCLAVFDEDGGIGQLRELAHLQREGAPGQCRGVLLVTGEFSVIDNHGMLLSMIGAQSPST